MKIVSEVWYENSKWKEVWYENSKWKVVIFDMLKNICVVKM